MNTDKARAAFYEGAIARLEGAKCVPTMAYEGTDTEACDAWRDGWNAQAAEEARGGSLV